MIKQKILQYGLLSFILVIVLSSCDYLMIKRSESLYQEYRSMLPDSVLKNFPKNLTNEFDSVGIYYPASLKHGVNYCGVIFETKPEKEIFDRYIYKLINTARYSGVIDDSLIYEIPLKNNYDSLDLKQYTQLSDRYFIPKLNEKYSYFENKNIKIADVYVLESGTQNILDLSPNERSNNFKREIKTGYSSGAFVESEKMKIYYWLIIW